MTEGALTLAGTLKLLQKFERSEFDEEFFRELDQDNGASKLAKTLIEECTQLHLLVGTVRTRLTRTQNFLLTLVSRKNLVTQIKETMEKMGKTVTVQYY